MTQFSLMSMNWLDFSIIGVIIISTAISVLRGFVREAISLVILAAAIFIAIKFSGPLGNHFASSIQSPAIRFIVAFIVLFIAVLLVGMVVSILFRTLVDKTGLSGTDRLLGLVFGFMRGLLVIGMVLMFIEMTSLAKEDWMIGSQLAPRFKPFVVWLDSFVPAQVGHMSAWVSGDVVDHASAAVTSK